MKRLLKSCLNPKFTSSLFVTKKFCLVALIVLIPQPVWSEEESLEELIEVTRLEVAEVKRKLSLSLGKAIYKRACMPCHGIQGDGKGPAAAKDFEPLPRDFTQGVFKWRTTVSGALPTDEDLDRTIRVGIPGTEMVGWGGIFSKEERLAVIQYIKTFSIYFQDPDYQLVSEDYVNIPTERLFPTTKESIAAGKETFEKKRECWKCHGHLGRGDGPSANNLKDDWNNPIKPYDLTQGYYRGGKNDRDIYRAFTTGLNGTPMPAFAELTIEERWQLVDYVKSLEQEKNWFFFLF